MSSFKWYAIKHHLNFDGHSYISYLLQNMTDYLPKYSIHPSHVGHSFEFGGGFIYIQELQERQCVCNETLWRIHVTIVAVQHNALFFVCC
jgi:hypothetical protein